MPNSLLTLKQKIDQLHLYFFPEQHPLSVHKSTINANTLFYIRLFSLLYLTSIYIWSITETGSALNNVIYLTMQGYFMTWLYFLLCMQDYLINGLGKWGRVFPMANKYHMGYFLIVYQIAFCVELPITIIFWGFLFKLILNMNVGTAVIIVNANLHAGPLLVLCLDTAFNTFSFPKQHFHAVLLFGFLYAIVNLSYSLSAHIIYQPIDWVSILSYILMASSIGMTFLMHWLGRYIYNKCKKDKIESSMNESLIQTDRKQQQAQKQKNSQTANSDKQVDIGPVLDLGIREDSRLNQKL